jgi:hypothetical protein
LKQAEVMAGYFEGQGEQDCEIWFEDRGVKAPLTDIHNKPWKKTVGEDVIVQCYTPE